MMTTRLPLSRFPSFPRHVAEELLLARFDLPKWATLDLGLQRVYAEAASDNIASIRAIERAGFRREGLLRAHCKTHGRRHDCVMFSVVPSDFAAAAADEPSPPG